jgi:hypothetical protein
MKWRTRLFVVTLSDRIMLGFFAGCRTIVYRRAAPEPPGRAFRICTTSEMDFGVSNGTFPSKKLEIRRSNRNAKTEIITSRHAASGQNRRSPTRYGACLHKPGLRARAERRVSFYSQQKRAFNLISALCHEKILKPSSTVAVVGAGLAHCFCGGPYGRLFCQAL